MSNSTKQHKAKAPSKLRFAIITCSTSRHRQLIEGEPVKDASGNLIDRMLREAGHSIVLRRIVSDDKDMIEKSIRDILDSTETDVAIFCGGTGITPSDIAIETISPVLVKVLPGFGEIFRRLSFDQIGSAAILSRAVAGVAKGKVFFCIPGSPDAVRLCLETLILPEAGHVVKHARE